MKNLILTTCLLLAQLSYGQWTYKTIKSDFDGSFKKAYTETNNYGWLSMETASEDNNIYLYLRGLYYCDEEAIIDIVFETGTGPIKFSVKASKSNDSKYYYFEANIWSSEFLSAFIKSTKIKIRVNQDYCDDIYYQFSMKNSSAALEFIVSEDGF